MRRALLALSLLLPLGLTEPAWAQHIPMDLNADTLLVVRENRAEVWDRHTRRKRWERDISDPSPSPLGPGHSSWLDCYAWLTPQSVMSLCQDSPRLQAWNIYTGQRERVWFLPGPLLGPLPVRSYFPTQASNSQPPPQALILGRPEIQVRTSAGQLQHTLFPEAFPQQVLANSHQVVALLPGGRLQSWDLSSGHPGWRFAASGTGPFSLAWGERWGALSNGQGEAVVLTPEGQVAGNLQSPLFPRRNTDHLGRIGTRTIHTMHLLETSHLTQAVHLLEEMVIDGNWLMSRSNTPQILGNWLWKLPEGTGKNMGPHLPPQDIFGSQRLTFHYPWIGVEGNGSWRCRLPTCSTVRHLEATENRQAGWHIQFTGSTLAPYLLSWYSTLQPKQSGYTFSESLPALLTPEHLVLREQETSGHTDSDLEPLGSLTSINWRKPAQYQEFETGLMVHSQYSTYTPHLLAAGPVHIVAWGMRPTLGLWDHVKQSLSPPSSTSDSGQPSGANRNGVGVAVYVASPPPAALCLNRPDVHDLTQWTAPR